MIARLLANVFGTQNERELKKLQPLVTAINAFEPSLQKLSDEALQEKTNEFRKRLTQGATLDDILAEAFAVVREASRRTLQQRHYDVQLMGGIVLHQGKISEMKTGEGKTLTATLPLYLNALAGKGACLVTVNDYLARRDAEWMSPVYEFLGLTVGILQNQMSDDERKEAYRKDILYATNNELGFDYLRDNMKFRLSDYVQRELNYAIVDEIDSILIDEARTPLIISGPTDQQSELYVQADRIVSNLTKNEDFEVNEKERHVTLTEVGVDKVEEALSIKNLYAPDKVNQLHHIMQALKAHSLFKRDVDYLVVDEKVLIVDEFTGRVLAGRRYSEGLHQALEAKEKVEIERESQTLASITLQNFFRMYTKLAGMTGTAATEAEEFHRIYKLDVVSVPTNEPVIRQDKPDLIFLTKEAKNRAIVEDVKQRYAKKQPILIGTIAVETSEHLSYVLKKEGIPHEVLNAKQHEREASIVEHAGEPGAITIATNMAGRGTDIKLTPESKKAGGLYILGTERHESRRIDNQLRGRSGRQGDPGESRFYIALEDDLIRNFAGEAIQGRIEMVKRMGADEDEAMESSVFSWIIESALEKVEKRNFDIRKHLLEYDDVLNQQRTVVYEYRRSVLEGEDKIFELVRDLIIGTVSSIFGVYTRQRRVTPDDYNQILLDIARIINVPVKELHNINQNEKGSTQFIRDLHDTQSKNTEVLIKDISNFLLLRYELYSHRIGKDEEITQETRQERLTMMQEAQKWLMLETIDNAWKQHMLSIDQLKEGIGLRGWGQKNPLIEYKREAFDMFRFMMDHVRREIVHNIFRINLERFDKAALEAQRMRELAELQMAGSNEQDEEKSPNLSRAERRKKTHKK